jgi:hypothetical protein
MNKINYKKIGAAVMVFSLFILLPLVVSFAQTQGTPKAIKVTIDNPLGANNMEVKGVLEKIMNIVELVGGIVVAFFIIFSGFKFVMAKGNPGDLEKAREMFYATVIGGAILLGAGIITEIVVTTVETIKG